MPKNPKQFQWRISISGLKGSQQCNGDNNEQPDETITSIYSTSLFSMNFDLEVSKILPIFVYRNQEKQGDKSGHRLIPKWSRISQSYMRNDTQIQGRG